MKIPLFGLRQAVGIKSKGIAGVIIGLQNANDEVLYQVDSGDGVEWLSEGEIEILGEE